MLTLHMREIHEVLVKLKGIRFVGKRVEKRDTLIYLILIGTSHRVKFFSVVNL